jgi:hypothetical protein
METTTTLWPPTDYLLFCGVRLTDLLIAAMAVVMALSIGYITWYVLTCNGLRPPPRWLRRLFRNTHRHHHNNSI